MLHIIKLSRARKKFLDWAAMYFSATKLIPDAMENDSSYFIRHRKIPETMKIVIGCIENGNKVKKSIARFNGKRRKQLRTKIEKNIRMHEFTNDVSSIAYLIYGFGMVLPENPEITLHDVLNLFDEMCAGWDAKEALRAVVYRLPEYARDSLRR